MTILDLENEYKPYYIRENNTGIFTGRRSESGRLLKCIEFNINIT